VGYTLNLSFGDGNTKRTLSNCDDEGGRDESIDRPSGDDAFSVSTPIQACRVFEFRLRDTEISANPSDFAECIIQTDISA
jgi:hypothetical protein